MHTISIITTCFVLYKACYECRSFLNRHNVSNVLCMTRAACNTFVTWPLQCVSIQSTCMACAPASFYDWYIQYDMVASNLESCSSLRKRAHAGPTVCYRHQPVPYIYTAIRLFNHRPPLLMIALFFNQSCNLRCHLASLFVELTCFWVWRIDCITNVCFDHID